MMLKTIKLIGCALFACSLLALLSCQPAPVEHVHTTITLEAVEASCTTPGKTAGEKCTSCGQMTVVQRTIPAPGHSYSDEWTIDREPTEYEAGERSRHCTVCSERVSITEIPRLTTYTEGLAYELNEDGTGYTCTGIGSATAATELHIPSSYQGLPVTAIANSAFANNKKLISVNVGSGVRFIDKFAFRGCTALKLIEIPDTVEYIAGQAFASTAYAANSQMWENGALYIGNHLIEVKPASANGSYTIHAGTRTVAGMAFYNCKQLTEITIPEGVVSIGNSAFYGCTTLRSIQLPDSLQTIGQGALAYCISLQSFHMPAGVRELLSNPFPGCSALRTITTDAANAYFVAVDNCLIEIKTGKLWSAAIGATIPEGGIVRSIGMAAFYHNKALMDIVIPEGVEEIHQSAFYECTNLQTVSLPSSLTKLDTQAFYGCSSLGNVSLPERLTYIGENAFAYCNKLTAISLPDSVTYVGDNAFASCFALSQLRLPDTLEYLGTDALSQCNLLQTESYGNCLYVGNWVVGVANKELTTVQLKSTTRGIASSAFSGYSSLQSIELPESLVFIGDQAFLGCWRLTEIRIPEGVHSLGYQTFAYCSYLQELSLPSTLTHLEQEVLLNCSALQTLYFAGTARAWDSMQKDNGWDSGTGATYTVTFPAQ